MTNNAYDVIVVGARCAGSPTAMLLARKGYRVLVVDRATFPSDTVSTHLIHAPGVAALARWRLLDRVTATGCPPIHTYAFDFGPFTLAGRPGTEQAPAAYAPRRTVLDEILLQAASEAGAEIRQGFTVEELLLEDGRFAGIRGHAKAGHAVTERARVVVGADGRHSLVAETVGAESYEAHPQLQGSYYSYWSGLPMDGRFETYLRDRRGLAAWPTNDDLTVVIAGWPFREFGRYRKDVERNFLETIDLVPSFAARLRTATRHGRFAGTAVQNYFRKPYGPGWALVGDAGYNKDFITAYGIQDAFMDAELCSDALDEAFQGDRTFAEAMSNYQTARDDRALPFYAFTTQIATLDPPPPGLAGFLAGLAGDREGMGGFVRVAAGVTSPAEFFSGANLTH